MFKKKGIAITNDDFDPVIHCAPGAAYKLLKKVYTILTGKEISDTEQAMNEDVPDYAKPTIAMKAKDHQINRIIDVEMKSTHAKMMITTHNELLKTERLNPERYTRTGFKKIKDATIASAKVLQRKPDATQDGTQDVKEVYVKTANKAVRIMR